MVEWRISQGLTAYPQALADMQARVEGIIAGQASEQVWLLEHPPLYTAGTSAKAQDLLNAACFPVYEAGRGGEYTYHGPHQRIAYVMLDLNQRARDLRGFVQQLERWLITTLAHFNVQGFTREGRIGVWVEVQDTQGNVSEAKIAAIGIRVRKWVSFHGVSLNVAPDLSHYAGIVPCGISSYGVTSLAALGIQADMAQVDTALRDSFEQVFGG
jgi:lipoyl(octanoyl) transferase